MRALGTQPLSIEFKLYFSIPFSLFSTKWSYGIVLWEIFTRGFNPYPNLGNADIEGFLKQGKRLNKPEIASENM